MRKLVVIVGIVFLSSLPAMAQGRMFDVMAHATWVDLTGEGSIDFSEIENDPLVSFEADQGWGAGVNLFVGGRFSLEVTASTVSPEVNLDPTNSPVPGFVVGDLQMIPITGVVQFHFAPNGAFDPYIGAGVAYILFDDIDDARNLDEVDIDAIDFDDDYGLVYNAGVTVAVSRAIGINLDAKYVPSDSQAQVRFTGGAGETFDIAVDPLILSAGIRVMF